MKLDSCCDRRILVLITHKLFEVYKEDIIYADSGLGDKELLAMENEQKGEDSWNIHEY